MLSNRSIYRYRVVCLVLIAISCSSFMSAQTTVSITPGTKNVVPTGGNFSLAVNIANAVNVHAFHVVFTLNNAAIRYVGRIEGSFLNDGGVNSTFFLSNPSASPSVASVTVDNAILGTDAVTGDGTLFTITFAPVANGSSAVTISAIDLRDANNVSLPVTTQSGSVTVTNPATAFVNPAFNAGNAGGHDFGFDAFSVLASAASAVTTGGTINLASATYNETVTLSRNVTLVPTGGTPIVQNLTQNTASVSLSGDIQVSGTLTLTSGVLSTGANKVIISNGAPGAVAITSGSVTGEVQRTISAAATGTYMFTNVNTQLAPSGAQGLITASIRSFPGTTPPNIGTGTAVNRYYTVTPSGPLTATLRLAYLDGEINGINETAMTLFRYTGVAWAPAVSIPNPANNYVEAPGISSFSDWTIGDGDHPLPIQLSSFTGTVLGNGNVRLDWITISEVSNYGFYVQRKRPSDLEFIELPNSFIPGNGTTNEPHSYAFTDIAPGQGSWQYRLKQIDLNSMVHYTEPVIVDVLTGVNETTTPLSFALKQNYPNPFNPSTTIEYTLSKGGYTSLKIYNLLGQEVASLIDGVVEAGRHSMNWNASALPSSIYLCKLTSSGGVETRKLVLAK